MPSNMGCISHAYEWEIGRGTQNLDYLNGRRRRCLIPESPSSMTANIIALVLPHRLTTMEPLAGAGIVQPSPSTKSVNGVPGHKSSQLSMLSESLSS